MLKHEHIRVKVLPSPTLVWSLVKIVWVQTVTLALTLRSGGGNANSVNGWPSQISAWCLVEICSEIKNLERWNREITYVQTYAHNDSYIPPDSRHEGMMIITIKADNRNYSNRVASKDGWLTKGNHSNSDTLVACCFGHRWSTTHILTANQRIAVALSRPSADCWRISVCQLLAQHNANCQEPRLICVTQMILTSIQADMLDVVLTLSRSLNYIREL